VFDFLRRRKQQRAEAALAYEQGQQAGAAISEDAATIVDAYCTDRRERFLMVLDQRLTGIVPVEGVSFNEQAQIELQIMWENWNKRTAEQEAEVWNIFWEKWGEVMTQLGGEDAIKKIISSRLSWHSAELFSQGVENSVEALERSQKQK
jgi:hypothetical protein